MKWPENVRCQTVIINTGLSLCTCREDFNLMFESENSTHSVYQLLEEACIALMGVSFTLKGQDGSPPLHKAVYYRTLWSE